MKYLIYYRKLIFYTIDKAACFNYVALQFEEPNTWLTEMGYK